MLSLKQVEWASRHDWYIGRKCVDIVGGVGEYKVKVLERTRGPDGWNSDKVRWFSDWVELRAWAGY